MRAASFRAFSDELQKIAMSLDAETRNNMAMRHEVPDFLLEGRLESNDSKETGFVPKLAETTLKDRRDELQEKYRKVRKPGSAALKGAFGGAFLGNVLTGGSLGGKGWARRLGYSGFAGLGAAAGLGDHYAQKRYTNKKRREAREARLKAKTATDFSATFTPAREAARARKTGGFHDKQIHKGNTIRPATIGQQFRIPE